MDVLGLEVVRIWEVVEGSSVTVIVPGVSVFMMELGDAVDGG